MSSTEETKTTTEAIVSEAPTTTTAAAAAETSIPSMANIFAGLTAATPAANSSHAAAKEDGEEGDDNEVIQLTAL